MRPLPDISNEENLLSKCIIATISDLSTQSCGDVHSTILPLRPFKLSNVSSSSSYANTSISFSTRSDINLAEGDPITTGEFGLKDTPTTPTLLCFIHLFKIL